MAELFTKAQALRAIERARQELAKQEALVKGMHPKANTICLTCCSLYNTIDAIRYRRNQCWCDYDSSDIRCECGG